MLFWHLGGSLWLFRWIFGDSKVDIRFLLLGAILPDLIDLPIGTMLFADVFSTGELWMHSLIAPALYMSLVLVFTRRGGRRRTFMAVGVGWLFQPLLDGVWVDQAVFFWPFFGFEIPPGETPYWPLAWERAQNDPWRWVKDAAGLSYLVWLWFASGLNDRMRRRSLWSTGRLPDHVLQGTD